jgi:hypothetical protein
MSNTIYSQIQTFDELCKLGCDFIENKIKIHPFLIVDQTKDNLYELVGKNEWIRDYLYQYNLMGFYTVISQPGLDYPIHIYPTYLDYKNSFILQNDIKSFDDFMSFDDFGVKQRAEIEGFIKLDIGVKIYNKFKDDPRIKIALSNIPESFSNNIPNSNFKSIDQYTTLSYKKLSNENIKFMENEAESNESARKEFKGSERNYKLSQLYHVVRRYFIVRNYSIKKHIQNLLDTDIVGISIMDLEWNNNDYLWNKIYLYLKQI